MVIYKTGIKNLYQGVFFTQAINTNPNGDPGAANLPRVDYDNMHGIITDVAQKRNIRDYIDFAYSGEPGMNIIVQRTTNVNRAIATIKEDAGLIIDDKTKLSILKARTKACEMFYDVRTFGAVLSTGPDSGTIRGPVQITFAESLSPVTPQDISITRCMTAKDLKKAKSADDYLKWEQEQNYDELRTMGRKAFIPYGLFKTHFFVSANLAQETGFSESDMEALENAILGMYEHNHSASKSEMSVVGPLILFKHVGTDSNEEQRARQALLGCAPAHKLFESVVVEEKSDLKTPPRSYKDYNATVNLSLIKEMYPGVEVGFKSYIGTPISWNKLPDNEDWFKLI